MGIIGVVAALTIPTLIANYQKQVLVTQLQKTVTTFQNGIRMINASEEVDNIFNSSFGSTGSGYSEYEVYPNEIAKFLGWETSLNDYELDIEGEKFSLPYSLKSGARFAFNGECLDGGGTPLAFSNGYKLGDDCVLSFQFDVNGPKHPNKFGKDIFQFNFYPDGRVNSYMVDAVLPSGGGTSDLKLLCNGKSDETEDWLSLCGYYIMQNGWKMDY